MLSTFVIVSTIKKKAKHIKIEKADNMYMQLTIFTINKCITIQTTVLLKILSNFKVTNNTSH